MTADRVSILNAVVSEFLRRVEDEGEIPTEVVEELKRLARDDELTLQEALVAAVKENIAQHGDAEDS